MIFLLLTWRTQLLGTAIVILVLIPAVTWPSFAVESPLCDTQVSVPPISVLSLQEVFPQVGDGEVFVYKNNGGMLTNEYPKTEECRHSGTVGLRLIYQMAGAGNAGWGVLWKKTPQGHFDASQFTALAFWIKGMAGGETFQIGLKDTAGKQVKVAIKPQVVRAAVWTLVTVPLSSFADRDGKVNTAAIEDLSFGFNQSDGTGTNGKSTNGTITICIDDIRFTKE